MFDPNAIPSTPTEAQTQAAVLAATDRLIAEAAAKHGLTIDQIPEHAKADARRTAIEMVAHENNPYRKLYEESQSRNKALEAMVAASSANNTSRTPSSSRAPLTVEQLRGRVGEQSFYLMTQAQKIQAIGLDPANLSRPQLKELFGRNSDPRVKTDFQRSNGALYSLLREAAKITGDYGG